MKTTNNIEQEINQIRVRIYEETKNMTVQERVERVNKIGEEAAKKYGFKRVARANKKTPEFSCVRGKMQEAPDHDWFEPMEEFKEYM